MTTFHDIVSNSRLANNYIPGLVQEVLLLQFGGPDLCHAVLQLAIGLRAASTNAEGQQLLPAAAIAAAATGAASIRARSASITGFVAATTGDDLPPGGYRDRPELAARSNRAQQSNAAVADSGAAPAALCRDGCAQCHYRWSSYTLSDREGGDRQNNVATVYRKRP